MYNDYNDLSFDEQLHNSEESIRRRHNQQMFLRCNAELLQQELELEAELIEENPELAKTIHSLNTLESSSNQQGFHTAFDSNSSKVKNQSIWSRFFPGLGRGSDPLGR